MTILDGKAVAKAVREEIKKEAEILAQKGESIGLAVVLVGENPASQVYVRNKEKACLEVGINSTVVKMSETSTQEEIIQEVERLNADKSINGIIVQLPLPKGIDENTVLGHIAPHKDVDGCTPYQKGLLWTGRPSLIACTPYGVIKILEHYNIPISGKNAVVVGRSNLVGKPLAQLLLDRNATVTICHSKTANLKEVTKSADILCVAIGRENFITEDMVKEGAVVIDVGINRTEKGLKGDVDFENVKDKCSFITPVPGGVGPMTVTMLLYNTLTSKKLSLE